MPVPVLKFAELSAASLRRVARLTEKRMASYAWTQVEGVAWSQVPIRAQYPHVELQGVADGVLAQGIIGMAEVPYYLIVLIVVEAKRGLESLESLDPRFQLCGQILAAARLNWERDQQPVQEIFGCYTIIDTWKFLRATVQDIETDAPYLLLEPSREYTQKTEAETILKILKRIVAKHHPEPVEEVDRV
jgi:hypothetical protein